MELIKIVFRDDDFKIIKLGEKESFENIIDVLNNDTRIIYFSNEKILINMDNVLYIQKVEQ